MKVFSSVVALLFTSAAATNVHELPLTNRHAMKALTSVGKADEGEEVPCVREAITMLHCLGTEFTICLVNMLQDLSDAEFATCEEAETAICPDLVKCAEMAAAPCTDEVAAFETCANEEEGEGEEAECDFDCGLSTQSKSFLRSIN